MDLDLLDFRFRVAAVMLSITSSSAIKLSSLVLEPVLARLELLEPWLDVVVGVVTEARTIGLNSDVEPKPELVVLSMAVVVAEIDLEERLRLEGRERVASWLLPLVTVVEPKKVWPSP